MKKKPKEITKVSMFYDRKILIINIIVFLFFLFAIFVIYHESDIKEGYTTIKFLAHLYSFEWLKYVASSGGKTVLGLILIVIFWPLMLFFVLFQLRRRRLDKNGVSATYFGVRYKHINWEDLQSVTRTRIIRKMVDERIMDNVRDVLIFTSKRNIDGKTTVIMMDTTTKARRVTEKYFGPPVYVRGEVTFN